MSDTYKIIENIEQFKNIKNSADTVLFYFSHDQCNVCKVLKPKIYNMLMEKFNKVAFFYVNTKDNPETAAQNRIFTVPTILVYFAGKEYIRKSRHIGLEELENEIARPYSMMFED